jgi:hypothetical protein
MEINADVVFHEILRRLRKSKKGCRRYWELISFMQELSNKGCAEAKCFMKRVDISRIPRFISPKSWTQRLQEGPISISTKGVRRQLHADPFSPNKTFGMRPHQLRGGPYEWGVDWEEFDRLRREEWPFSPR